MDYLELTAPCGLDCFNCAFYLATQGDQGSQAQLAMFSELLDIPVEAMSCQGCRAQKGVLPLHFTPQISPREPGQACRPYSCTEKQGIDFCFQCDDFPCEALHPYSDRAGKVPHNLKVFNLCQIKKMGLQAWAENQASKSRQAYFFKWWTLL
jgi:hypothetical protein